MFTNRTMDKEDAVHYSTIKKNNNNNNAIGSNMDGPRNWHTE